MTIAIEITATHRPRSVAIGGITVNECLRDERDAHLKRVKENRLEQEEDHGDRGERDVDEMDGLG